MEALKGWKSQATSVLVALFVVFNAIFEDTLTLEQEAKIIGGLVALAGFFLSMKMQRNGGAK